MKKYNNGKKIVPAFFFLIFICGVLGTSSAKTRWSSLHFIPDADFLAGGHYVIDMQGYTFADSAKGQVLRPSAFLTMGIIEWVNLEIGYAGNVNLGFKARLINESGNYIPSIAVGARNIISSKETNYFESPDTMKNAFFVALAKSVEPIRLRIHAGLQTIPSSSKDQVDPFFGLEEYFGNGLYATLELSRLKGAFCPSLFISWRILKKNLEFSAGAVALNRLFFDTNNKFNVNLTTPASSKLFMRPGFWLGIRYHGFLRMGKTKVFASMDDQVKDQGNYIESLKKQVDSIKTALAENLTRLAKVDNSIVMLSDSIYTDRNRLKAALYDKLIALKILYESEPFEPELARQAISRIVAIKENALPILKEFVIDKKQDRKIRLFSISLIGEMGGTGASDALLDVLSQSEDPDVKIEILIALGKTKETRALFVMEQLANDPIDVVAFTAQEVLTRIVKEKGIKLSPDFKMRTITMSDTPTIKEEKIPVQRAKKGQSPDAAKVGAQDTLKPAAASRIEKDTQDVWGMQVSGKDSLAGKTMKKGQGKPVLSDTTRGLPDTLETKGNARPATTAAPADSAAIKSVGNTKIDEKAQSTPEKKKQKEQKKKPSYAPTSDDKSW
jgi:hypothetical protein